MRTTYLQPGAPARWTGELKRAVILDDSHGTWFVQGSPPTRVKVNRGPAAGSLL